MEAEGSSPYSQVPATCPYQEPARSSPYPHILLPEDSSQYYPSIYACVSLLFLSLSFPIKNLCTPIVFPIRTTCPSHLTLSDFITLKTLGEEYRSLSSSFLSFLHSPVTSSLLGPNILLYTPFSNTHSLRSSLNMSDQVTHPYTTTGKIVVFLDSKVED
jgi:hypothetical protein